jgi:hypothetical protein
VGAGSLCTKKCVQFLLVFSWLAREATVCHVATVWRGLRWSRWLVVDLREKSEKEC